jgi:2-methylcitrate dehydratase PrpD
LNDIAQKNTTAYLAHWAYQFKLEDAPLPVIERMKTLILDLLRVVSVGSTLPWSQSARRVALSLGGTPTSSVLLHNDQLDAARAAFVNGAFAHACDLDDTHVGSMHHPGASILPAVIAIAERDQLCGRQLLEAAIVGYEASLRIGLAVQPYMFQRGFMATPTCGTLGAALAVGKLLKFAPTELCGALGAASTYAGGLAQFYHSGSVIKRINGGKAAECGVLAALLTQSGIWGPRDILEGEAAGFFTAFASQSDYTKITGDLGLAYRLMEVSTKAHAGAGRLQASNDAGLELASTYQLQAERIVSVEVGIPKVIQGMLTRNDPPDLQSAQLSVPFSLAIALAIGHTRGASAGLRRDDYESALRSPIICALSSRVKCVLDAEIEAMTNTEEVPSRVTIQLDDGRELTAKVAHPRGSPHRPMTWQELSALFRDTVSSTHSPEAIEHILKTVAALDYSSTTRQLVDAFKQDLH